MNRKPYKGKVSQKVSQMVNVMNSNAPYNFVPLNDRVIPAEKLPDFDRYHSDRYTGYIDLEIKALTPLYIRDSLTLEEYREKQQRESFSNPSFFSPGGVGRIPGSSLRGMLRTLVEIVSYGKLEFFDGDRRLYFRFMADSRKELRQYYKARTETTNAGVLIKRGFRDFVIKEADYQKIEDTSSEGEIVKKDDGWIIYSGAMSNKKHNWQITQKKDAKEQKELPVDYDSVIRSYCDDSTRKSRINLIKYLEENKDFKDGVPCFYTYDKNSNTVTAIGHTKNMRLPYLRPIKKSVRQTSQDLPDIPTAIFGDEKHHAGRVFFEDAIAEKVEFLNPAHPKILSSPKPTCIQHYLKQDRREMRHYDSPDSTIRGYKLYWHRDGRDWVEKDTTTIEQHRTQYTMITPVKEGSVFKGRIRFENLTKVELGALLFVLDLPEGLAHKIGMAKPLGLGSIRITPELYLSNREKRYTDLFAEWNGLELQENTREYKIEFEKYMLEKLGRRDKQSLWEINRIQTLKIVLSWKNKPSNEKTQYLGLGEFRKRPILPAPEEVMQNKS